MMDNFIISTLSIYLSSNTAYALMSIFGRVCPSCCEKEKRKSMPVSLQTDRWQVEILIDKGVSDKNRFHRRIHLKEIGVWGV